MKKIFAIIIVLIASLSAYCQTTEVYYTYDALGRIKTVEVIKDDTYVQTTEYNYDGLGNRTEKVVESAPILYEIQVSAIPSIGGIVTGGGHYEADCCCTITATSNPGYTFAYWSDENGTFVDTDSIFSFHVTDDKQYVAHFDTVPIMYSITAVCNPENAGTVMGTGVYMENEMVTLAATASNEDFSFVSWSDGNGSVVFENPYSFPATANMNFVANFEALPFTTYIVNASVYPSNSGFITGTGEYIYGEIVTLVATAYSEFEFLNWEKDGVIVSSEPTYSFPATDNVELVANFSIPGYHWEAIQGLQSNMTVNGIVRIDGEQMSSSALEIGAFCNNECRARERAVFFPPTSEYIVPLAIGGSAGETITFRVYDHIANLELDDLTCLSELTFKSDTMIGDMQHGWFVIDFVNMIEHSRDFVQGWNWYSTYVDLSQIDGLTMLEESLGSNGYLIKSSEAYVQNFYNSMGVNYWFGGLSNIGISNDKLYKVNTTSPCTAVMTGKLVNPSEPINVIPGWNWIGFPSPLPLSVESALSDFVPTNGDVLKNQGAFTTFYEGYGWWPNFELVPGFGYMYYSGSNTMKTLVFASGRDAVKPITEMPICCQNDIHRYADNASIIAIVYLDGIELAKDGYEVSAFNDGECLGLNSLVYAEPVERHVVMLSVAGKEGDNMCFALYDANEKKSYRFATENISFTADALHGSLDNPIALHFSSNAGVSEGSLEKKMMMLPNPVDRGSETVVVVLPDNMESLESVEIINAYGETIRKDEGRHSNSIDCNLASGIYIVRVTTESGKLYVEKLIVR